MPTAKSALNGLLLQLDRQRVHDDARQILTTLGAIAQLFQDTDYEVNRDLFDGVSNETRRFVLIMFIAGCGEVFTRTVGLESAIGEVVAEASKDILKKGNSPEVPLDIILRQQQRKGTS